jgi:hypothetical protein
MEWRDINTLTFNENITRTLNDIHKKESELDLNKIPPIIIDMNGKIVDGVKRYLVLMKLGSKQVPVIKEDKSKKVFVSLNANLKIRHMLAA